MPFSNHGSGVAMIAEEAGDGCAVGWDERFSVTIEDASLKFGTPIITPRHDAVTRRSADG